MNATEALGPPQPSRSRSDHLGRCCDPGPVRRGSHTLRRLASSGLVTPVRRGV